MNAISSWLKSVTWKIGLAFALTGLALPSAGLRAESSQSSSSHSHHTEKATKKALKGVNSKLKLAINLETKFWQAVQEKNRKSYSNLLSPIFQGLSPSGGYSRHDQIQGLRQASLLGFGINNPIVTQKGKDLVFSYDLVAVSQKITSGPQISVWRKVKDKKGKWEMISHSYTPFSSVEVPI